MDTDVDTRTIERFLYREAELLDDLKLQNWLELFDEGAEYLVPTNNAPHADPASALFVINDDYRRLAGRVKRLQSRDAHAGYPHPRTRHLVTNVRAERVDAVTVQVRANFVVHAFKVGRQHVFVGEYHYVLRDGCDGNYSIRQKRVILDLESLALAGGKINIIL